MKVSCAHAASIVRTAFAYAGDALTGLSNGPGANVFKVGTGLPAAAYSAMTVLTDSEMRFESDKRSIAPVSEAIALVLGLVCEMWMVSW